MPVVQDDTPTGNVTDIKMLKCQHGAVYRSKTCIGNNDGTQLQLRNHVIDYHMLLIIPAKGANDAAGAFHCQQLILFQCPLIIGTNFVEINLLIIYSCCQMRRHSFIIRIAYEVLYGFTDTGYLIHIESIPRQESPILCLLGS